MNDKRTSLSMLVASMVIFGTIGVARRYIPLPSAAIAAVRGLVGAALLLLLVTKLLHRKLSGAAIRANLKLLLISGALIGLNWIALFEAYNSTTVAVATLCYYMAPVFVILLSPLVLKEKLTAYKLVCAAVAIVGMVLVSGVLTEGGVGGFAGVLLGLLAAALYAAVILLNKMMQPISGIDRSVLQLGTAGAVVLPYALWIGVGDFSFWTPETLILLAVVCVVHTALAYALYFGSMEGLPAHTIALLSYIDPVVAVLLSALLLHEPLTVWTVIGAVLIIGAAILGERPEKT